MPLIDTVQKDMVAAMKDRNEARLSALRMIKAALMKQKVDSPKPLDEAAEMQVLKSLVKQRTDSADVCAAAFAAGQGRYAADVYGVSGRYRRGAGKLFAG